MLKSGVTISKDETASLLKAIKALTSKQVLVGVPDSTAEREPVEGESPGLSNAAIGYIQEKGAPEANIPARPFLEPGVAGAKDQIAARFKSGAKSALTGDLEAVDATLNAVGLMGQNAARAKITDGPFAPLKPSTLANRKRRGRSGERPLIDTSQLRRALTYVIRGK